jgi:Bacterial protein of unknown function (DUF899)
MNLPPVVSPQEWEAAREELLVKEKKLTHARESGSNGSSIPAGWPQSSSTGAVIRRPWCRSAASSARAWWTTKSPVTISSATVRSPFHSSSIQRR